jgi:hypothetical protein
VQTVGERTGQMRTKTKMTAATRKQNRKRMIEVRKIEND